MWKVLRAKSSSTTCNSQTLRIQSLYLEGSGWLVHSAAMHSGGVRRAGADHARTKHQMFFLSAS